ncbi:nucleoid-associated protein [Paenibacillus cremeus]|uniref:Nucleoid-associated protein n=1 Tax=Paenibacillus cremeus TaxID=2163881 RepID=A0A559KAA6_9BACL|nr:nucleoid-associated protein [Paenibacillus cremeus]TVY09068.1 nucleoid-associated protein [Paenibacillus cremeus]
MPNIAISKLIAHDLALDKANPRTYHQLMDLSQVPAEVLDFFANHISNSVIAKQIKVCTFTHQNAAVLIDCLEISNDLSNDQLFIDNSINMTQSLFNVMKSTSSRSSGTLIFILYSDLDSGFPYLAILKMDPNKAIQIDRTNYKFVVQEDILPSLNEKLHKCAFIKLIPTLWDEEFHLRVLDKQQLTGEVSKYFLSAFLESHSIVDNKVMTELVSSHLVEYAVQEKIIHTQAEIVDFNAKVDRMLYLGKSVDLDRDLESLFKTLVPGDADRLSKIDGFKQKLVQKRENVTFEFVAEKSPTIAMLSDSENSIKIQFPLQDKDTKVFLDYKDEEDGSVTTIIQIKGVNLKEKFK